MGLNQHTNVPTHQKAPHAPSLSHQPWEGGIHDERSRQIFKFSLLIILLGDWEDLCLSWSSSWLPHHYGSVWTQRISIDRSSQAGINKNSPIKHRIVDNDRMPPDWHWAVSCRRCREKDPPWSSPPSFWDSVLRVDQGRVELEDALTSWTWVYTGQQQQAG